MRPNRENWEMLKGDKSPKTRLNLLVPRSLRNQLIGSVWLAMAIVYIPFNIYTVSRDTRKALEKQVLQLEDQGQIVSHLLHRWTLNTSKLVEMVAESQEVRGGNRQTAEDLFNRLKRPYPERNWILYNRSGIVVASTNGVTAGKEEVVSNKDYFKQAIGGQTWLDIIPRCYSGKACLMMSSPVYSPGLSKDKKQKGAPSGVLVMWANLSDTARDSGLEGEFRRISLGDGNRSNRETEKPLSLQNNRLQGWEALMVDNHGNVLFPLTSVNDNISLLETRQIMNSPWAPIIRKALTAERTGRSGELIAAGKPFFFYTERIDPRWSVVVVSDKQNSIDKVKEAAKELVLRQLVFLVLVSVVIAVVCRQIAKPILRAAETLKQFGTGNFEARIASRRSDEIGRLFTNINETGSKLLSMLNERLARAVTDKQIETATEIQKEFIVHDCLSNEQIEIAADFDPAYEIGADWYDVIHVDGISYVIIADVCDKGIPSALFMSVFRSLLRYSMEDYGGTVEGGDKNRLMATTLKRVNDYMAENHGSAAMFATVFLGAYRYDSGRIDYINAGHEAPLLIKGNNWKAIDRLETTGPAIGIFKGAKYEVKSVSYGPGDVLFCFTDGLVDSRSAEGESFGIDQLKQVLEGLNHRDASAQDILDHVNRIVERHSDGAEQFDDKTLLVMKARE